MCITTSGRHDRSPEAASHAWVEALLPGLGWVGFDPTNNPMAGERHIRTAIGRDYADVPPTRGIFKGKSESQLTVSVRVQLPTVRRRPRKGRQCRKSGKRWRRRSRKRKPRSRCSNNSKFD